MLQGQSRHEAYNYPDEQYLYYVAADKFGWTPNELDEQPAWLVDWLFAIAAEADKARVKSNDK